MHHVTAVCLVLNKETPFSYASLEQPLKSALLIDIFFTQSEEQRSSGTIYKCTILKKCREKFECLVYEMLFIQEKKPQLNTQSDSIKAKLFGT